MNFKRIILCMLCALAVLTAGCKSKNEPAQSAAAPASAFPVTVNGITFESVPGKVVSLSPFITDIIYDIGAQNLLAGVCDYCEVTSVSALGSAISPDVEAIKASGAKLVLTITPLDADTAGALKNAGISVMELKMPVSLETLENLYASLIAVLCGNADFQSQAAEIFMPVHQTVDSFEKSSKNVVCVVSEHMNIAGSNTLCNDIISLVANNAVSDNGYENVLDSASSKGADVILADISLEDKDISQYTGGKSIIYIDFSALESPDAENVSALITQICENL